MRALLALFPALLLALPASAAPITLEYHSDSDACSVADAVAVPAVEVCEVQQGGALHLGGSCNPMECILHADINVAGSGPPGDHLVLVQFAWDDATPSTLCEFSDQVLRGGVGCLVFVTLIAPVAADQCKVLALHGGYEVNLALVAKTVDRFELCRDATGEPTLRYL